MYWTVFPPLVLYMLVVKFLDTYTVSKVRELALSVVAGALLAMGASFIFSKIKDATGTLLVSWLFQIGEELLKLLPVAVLMLLRKIAFPIDVVNYGAAVGCGFALTENLLYLHFQELTLSEAVYRAMATSLMHIGCAALMGIALFYILFRKQNKVYQRWLALILIVLPWFIHIFFNANVVTPGISFILLIVIFSIFFLIVGGISDKQVNDWLYKDADTHITLLTAMANGTFAQTRPGQYLEQSRQSVSPEVFDKIEQYVRLCLQLSVQAKGREIAREMGVPLVRTEADNKKLQADFDLLQQLWRQIGITGRSIVHPIIHIGHSDKWSLEI